MNRDAEGKLIEYTHRIYGREKGKPRWRPLNLKDGCFCVNLIYATMIPAAEVEKVLSLLREQNSDIEVEARKI